ncbi:hypothetical protein [Cytobacillus sp.]|uniref:hypothetical protein n=1 Tax=Cytobacillus sp. TaxID=2675269 RepID=UPI003513E8EC
MQEQTNLASLRNKKPIMAVIGIVFILFCAFLVYKMFFTNPAGVDQKLYSEHLDAYEVMMKAYEEDRKLTSFEYTKIEDLDTYWDEKIDNMDDLGREEFEKTLAIHHSIEMMFMSFDHATDDIWDDGERKEKLDEFYIEAKTAKAALELK